jgi:hypothetical protein
MPESRREELVFLTECSTDRVWRDTVHAGHDERNEYTDGSAYRSKADPSVFFAFGRDF